MHGCFLLLLLLFLNQFKALKGGKLWLTGGFYGALFSALKQTGCTPATCDSEWVTVALQCVWICIHWSGYFWALIGCDMASVIWGCCHFCARSVHSVQPCTSLQFYSKLWSKVTLLSAGATHCAFSILMFIYIYIKINLLTQYSIDNFESVGTITTTTTTNIWFTYPVLYLSETLDTSIFFCQWFCFSGALNKSNLL